MIVLDTCSLVWLALCQDNLSRKAKVAIGKNDLAVSDISFWEMAMLIKKGRIKIDCDYREFCRIIEEAFHLKIVSISPEIAEISVNLKEEISKDPADRIISATAVSLKAELVTADENLRKSKEVKTIW